MASKEEMKSEIDRLMKRNVEISEIREKMQSHKTTDESKARDQALLDEFDGNQRAISELMMGLYRSEEVI
jgi:hypothetical protein